MAKSYGPFSGKSRSRSRGRGRSSGGSAQAAPQQRPSKKSRRDPKYAKFSDRQLKANGWTQAQIDGQVYGMNAQEMAARGHSGQDIKSYSKQAGRGWEVTDSKTGEGRWTDRRAKKVKPQDAPAKVERYGQKVQERADERIKDSDRTAANMKKKPSMNPLHGPGVEAGRLATNTYQGGKKLAGEAIEKGGKKLGDIAHKAYLEKEKAKKSLGKVTDAARRGAKKIGRTVTEPVRGYKKKVAPVSRNMSRAAGKAWDNPVETGLVPAKVPTDYSGATPKNPKWKLTGNNPLARPGAAMGGMAGEALYPDVKTTPVSKEDLELQRWRALYSKTRGPGKPRPTDEQVRKFKRIHLKGQGRKQAEKDLRSVHGD